MTAAFARRFAAAAQAREEQLRAAFQTAGVDTLELSTEDDITDAVLRFADMRRHRFADAGAGMNAVNAFLPIPTGRC